MFTPTTKEELKQAIISYMNNNKSYGHIYDWDVSHITDMSNLFSDIPMFNEPITKWNVSNVTSMANMFYECTYFNQDLSYWDVSQVTDMSCMFYQCKNFTGLSHHKKWSCISRWDTHNVINMTRMLEGARLFIAKIHNWDVSHVIYCKDFHKNCCYMRRNLPSFSKEAMQLELIIPLSDPNEESPLLSPEESPLLSPEESPIKPHVLSPLQYSPPHQLIDTANNIIDNVAPKNARPQLILSPKNERGRRLISPEVEFLGVKKPLSPEVEFLGVKKPLSPEVQFLGVKKPLSPEVEFLGVRKPLSPEVEFLGVRRPIIGKGRKTKKKNKKLRKSITYR